MNVFATIFDVNIDLTSLSDQKSDPGEADISRLIKKKAIEMDNTSFKCLCIVLGIQFTQIVKGKFLNHTGKEIAVQPKQKRLQKPHTLAL